MINLCNIERFATHDGPGIRSVIFFQGCPLRCPWCANPESQVICSHLLYDEKKCIQCHQCEQHCPSQSIKFHQDQFTWNEASCLHCETCSKMCLHNAIEFVGKPMSIDAVMEEILKDKEYYETSHGGITISGGEAFLQLHGLIKLLRRLKKEQLHITIETCGQYPMSYLKQAYPYIDLFYFDIKHIDEKIYQDTIKGELSQVQENLRFLIQQDPDKVVFRVPVIPGFNYDDSTLHAIIDMANSYHIKEVHFLPYHTLGKVKYEKMQQVYPWSNTMLKEEELEPYKTYAENQHISLKIGG